VEAATAGEPRRFDHLREHSIGLPQVLFQSITHMAPAAAAAYSIYISVPDAQQALPLSVALALIACICAATAIGQLGSCGRPRAGCTPTSRAASARTGASSSPGCSSASSRSWPRFCTSSSAGR
jgi:amino acid transporter